MLSQSKSKASHSGRFASSPSRQELRVQEKSFILDCVAMGSIAKDYNCSLPKLGSVIPPYNAQRDLHAGAYFLSKPLPALLKRTGQSNGGTSTYGELADRFQVKGAAALYLSTRNNAGAGHSEDYVRGHGLFLSTIKPFFGYNGNYGYRRNVPSLRKTPSTFGTLTNLPLH
ncbi:uncharacterized protein C17orf98-like [Rhinatrema bivittatum]|uniref:uncharacterized protein C17orf98-like n=1 Tax=Rhinatrema bivittatum TaxID=194408 RepID=UPI0011283A9F|nr:uncharacterized protein C17orf98-like [Rhinatrema bivittatum]XP_029444562.1 uncharacterized protein C17orf98-like [Rhinatrema bivittatum]